MKKIRELFKQICWRIHVITVWILTGGVYRSHVSNKVYAPFKWLGLRIIVLGKDNSIELPKCFKGNIRININGNNNRVKVKGPFATRLTQIRILGDNNQVEIGASKDASFRIDVYPRLSSKCDNARVLIGDNVTTSNQTWLKVGESFSSLKIGDNVMISWDVTVWNTDSHSIFTVQDLRGVNPLNVGKHLEIGSHCWVGKNATILKNVVLPSETIVGTGAVVSKMALDESNCVLAGNPARVVKRGVYWDIRSPSEVCFE